MEQLYVMYDYFAELAKYVGEALGYDFDAEYTDRESAYLIPFRGTLVGVIQTSKGYFLLGGGVEEGESHSTCIERECMEEDHALCRMEYDELKGKLFVEMQNWALEQAKNF